MQCPDVLTRFQWFLLMGQNDKMIEWKIDGPPSPSPSQATADEKGWKDGLKTKTV